MSALWLLLARALLAPNLEEAAVSRCFVPWVASASWMNQAQG